MPTQLQNNKKILCCSGFAVHALAKTDDVKGFLAADFINAGTAFIQAASLIAGEAIAIPSDSGMDSKALCLTVEGSVTDAMGRLIGGSFALPAQGLIDAYTDAAEAIMNSI